MYSKYPIVNSESMNMHITCFTIKIQKINTQPVSYFLQCSANTVSGLVILSIRRSVTHVLCDNTMTYCQYLYTK